MKKKVYVAMSGGVDSSVAAALLKEQGYSVVGVFMKFWSPNIRGQSLPRRQAGPRGTVPGSRAHLVGGLKVESDNCIWKKEREDALRVASVLDIPLLTWDFTEEYEERVVNYMLDAYQKGITPNPDVMCNKEIKFGLFFDKAIAEGADFIATGHYARIASVNPKSEIRNPKQNLNYRNHKSQKFLNFKDSNFDIVSDLDIRNSNLYHLLKAKDDNKDQSYFLYTLKQEQLARTLFPIGEYTKPEVRKLAKKFNLPTAEKKDSQGICFIGPLKVREFLKSRIKPKKGVIICKTHNAERGTNEINRKASSVKPEAVIGEHDGVYYYTIGQRHGMDIKTGAGPYFVTGKDIQKNILYVGKEKDLYSKRAIVSDLEWVNDWPQMPAKVAVKIRYRSQDMPAIVSKIAKPLADQKVKIDFSQPLRAVTPGQAIVFYLNDKVLGGGNILK